MHTVGKVMACLVVVAAIAASVVTSKLVTVRNSWTSKNISAKKKFQELKPKVDELEDRVDQLKNEALRKQELWGKYWNGVQTNVNPGDGSLVLNIGLESGLSQNLLLHGFETAQDGSSIYRGSFVVTTVQNGSSQLKPNWKASNDEIRAWQAGGVWRWRNSIPPGVSENFDRQLLQILKAEETLSDRRSTLATQQGLLEEANEGLKRREDELVGGPSLEKSELIAPEFRDGLVAALEQAEEQRNKNLEEIDRLRREIREVYHQIEQIHEENGELIEKLPQPKASSDSPMTSKKETASTRKK